ncbi:hypothetical protein HOY82DRAFT_541977 [Tuber indicum]|nr:hypothetical protein HOY82DRAFT_541977 [Tuber indicum]
MHQEIKRIKQVLEKENAAVKVREEALLEQLQSQQRIHARDALEMESQLAELANQLDYLTMPPPNQCTSNCSRSRWRNNEGLKEIAEEIFKECPHNSGRKGKGKELAPGEPGPSKYKGDGQPPKPPQLPVAAEGAPDPGEDDSDDDGGRPTREKNPLPSKGLTGTAAVET